MREEVILLVENSPQDEELTLRALRKHNIKNRVVVARDGAAALDYLFRCGTHAGRDAGEVPQVILLDLNLPKMNGLSVLKKIRDDERTKLLPVVIPTSPRKDQDLLASYRSGCNSYVVKPVDFTHVPDAVKQLGLYWPPVNEKAP